MSSNPLKLPWWWKHGLLEVLRDCPRPFVAQAHSSSPAHCAIVICDPRNPFQAVQLEFHSSTWKGPVPSIGWCFEVAEEIRNATERLKAGHDQVRQVTSKGWTLEAETVREPLPLPPRMAFLPSELRKTFEGQDE